MISNSIPLMTPARIAVSVSNPNSGVSPFLSIKGSLSQQAFSVLKRNIMTCFQELYSCFVNIDGDLYSCEKFCDAAKIGNVKYGFDEHLAYPLLQKFTERKNLLCSSCWAQRFCRMCMTSLNYEEDEIRKMCDMERDTIDLALKYYCDLKDWELTKNKKIWK